uniref:Sugar transporter SWEET n=1 Tax=Rattus norvegicus TaxID=10116 RepID=A0A8I6AS30_RAT
MGAALGEGTGSGGMADSFQCLRIFYPLLTISFGSPSSLDLRHMQRTQSVDSIQFLPFLTMDVTNLGWLSYGVLKGDGTLIVNTVGAVLQTLYILAYLHYRTQKIEALPCTHLWPTLVHVGRAYSLISWKTSRMQLGLFCSVFTISMYLSPLADLAKIIQTKSTQHLSFSLTIATFLSSASLSIYGFHLKDPYIMVPNLPEILNGFVCPVLFYKYPPEEDTKYRLLLWWYL